MYTTILVLTTIYTCIIFAFGVKIFYAMSAGVFFSFASLLLFASFLDWLAHTHPSEKRLLPTLVGIVFFSLAVGVLVMPS